LAFEEIFLGKFLNIKEIGGRGLFEIFFLGKSKKTRIKKFPRKISQENLNNKKPPLSREWGLNVRLFRINPKSKLDN
jgi:hypothetical protein